ncbi:MAG TPA: sigma-70 family RNA polymerase sigma factor [Microbacteriaceae bacterium]|nr:sigma-70 family RNA polymerase sigma factor [Microbacteriaceae bacterium]
MEMKQPFESVVAQHGVTVLRVCRARLSIADADDAWSETFLAALRAYPELPETANVEAWLVTIARHKVIDIRRAAERAPLPVAAVPEGTTGLGMPGTGDTVGDDALWAAVGRLPAKQRRALTLRYLAGMSYREVAAALGGTAEAARRAAADGRKRLRDYYQDARSGAGSEKGKGR